MDPIGWTGIAGVCLEVPRLAGAGPIVGARVGEDVEPALLGGPDPARDRRAGPRDAAPRGGAGEAVDGLSFPRQVPGRSAGGQGLLQEGGAAVVGGEHEQVGGDRARKVAAGAVDVGVRAPANPAGGRARAHRAAGDGVSHRAFGGEGVAPAGVWAFRGSRSKCAPPAAVKGTCGGHDTLFGRCSFEPERDPRRSARSDTGADRGRNEVAWILMYSQLFSLVCGSLRRRGNINPPRYDNSNLTPFLLCGWYGAGPDPVR